MTKVLFEGSIFLHQKVGGVSNYIIQLNKKLKNYNIKSKIIAFLSINKKLEKTNSQKIYIRFENIPKFCRNIFFTFNDLFFLVYIKLFKPEYNVAHNTGKDTKRTVLRSGKENLKV